MKTSNTTSLSPIQKVDGEKRIVYGAVYAPGQVDTEGEIMLAEDIEKMAHRFMRMVKLDKSIDTMHNNKPNGSYPVESYIARENDPDFDAGTWVLGVKIEDRALWNRVKKGEINGYSFEALVKKVAMVVEIEYDPEHIGVTEQNDGHTHLFYARMDEDGKVVAGRTTTDAGHSHEIRRGTATERANGHSHRFFI